MRVAYNQGCGLYIFRGTLLVYVIPYIGNVSRYKIFENRGTFCKYIFKDGHLIIFDKT